MNHLKTLMKIWWLRRLCGRINHSWRLLMGHCMTLMLMKFWSSMRTIKSYSFCILSVIMIAISLLLLILLLKFYTIRKKKNIYKLSNLMILTVCCWFCRALFSVFSSVSSSVKNSRLGYGIGQPANMLQYYLNRLVWFKSKRYIRLQKCNLNF